MTRGEARWAVESWTAALYPGVETSKPGRKSRAVRAARPVTTVRKGRGGVVFLIAGVGLLLFLLFHFILPYSRTSKKNPKDGAKMVWNPAGEFFMGSVGDQDAGADEKPRHKVFLDGYWMYKYDVTVAQYRTFCRATRRQMPYAPSWGWLTTTRSST